jgi:hypothetical protein
MGVVCAERYGGNSPRNALFDSAMRQTSVPTGMIDKSALQRVLERQRSKSLAQHANRHDRELKKCSPPERAAKSEIAPLWSADMLSASAEVIAQILNHDELPSPNALLKVLSTRRVDFGGVREERKKIHLLSIKRAFAIYVAITQTNSGDAYFHGLRESLKLTRYRGDPIGLILRALNRYPNSTKTDRRRAQQYCATDAAAIRHLIEMKVPLNRVVKHGLKKGEGVGAWAKRKWLTDKSGGVSPRPEREIRKSGKKRRCVSDLFGTLAKSKGDRVLVELELERSSSARFRVVKKTILAPLARREKRADRWRRILSAIEDD